MPAIILFVGNPDYGSQYLTAIEAGWRHQPHRRLSLDLAVFYNRYSELRFLERGTPEFLFGEIPYIRIPMSPINGPGARTWGTEALAIYQATRNWELTGSYSWLRSPELRHVSDLQPAEVADAANHLASLRSQLDLTARTELDATAYYVDGLPGSAEDGLFPREGVPSAVRLDVRFSRAIAEHFELSVVGQDLLYGHRREFTPEGVAHPADVRRGIYAQFRWRY
jgi:iron complex outermembrane receptor protein